MNSLMEFHIKHEEDPLMITEIKSEPQVEETQENLMKLVGDNEEKSQKEEKNTGDEEIIGLLLINESCENYGKDLKKEPACVQKRENVNPFPQFNDLGFCNKDFSDECVTLMYVRSGDNRYTCNLCNKTFTSKQEITRHIRTHTNDKPFACDICSKTFSQKCHLISHIRLHINEKPFTCTICTKSFSYKSNLVKHIRTHTNEKPFTCTICRKSFSNKSNLVTHIRIHTNEKPFTCAICGVSFSHKSNLVKHIRTHTNEEILHL